MNMDLEIFGYKISIHPNKKEKVFEVHAYYGGDQKLHAIKGLRNVYFDYYGDNLGLLEAKNIIDGKATMFITTMTQVVAEDICRKLLNLGIETKIVEIKK